MTKLTLFSTGKRPDDETAELYEKLREVIDNTEVMNVASILGVLEALKIEYWREHREQQGGD